MRVIIDITPLKSGHKHRGIGAYTRNLVEALQRVSPENEYFLTSKPGQINADMIHYPYFDFFFLTLPLAKSLPAVVTIHDTVPLLYPEAYKPGLRGKLKFALQKRSLAAVKAIVTDSNASKRDIVNHLKQPETKVHRVYLAADPRLKPMDQTIIQPVLVKYGISSPYFLYVGDINYNKNLPALIKAYAAANVPQGLVLVSRALREPTPQAHEIHSLIRSAGLSARITVLTEVPLDPAHDLNALYSGADWYIQPSLYEGFGLPVLEAIAAGTPVIVSTGGSLPEITPPGTMTFDPTSEAAITNVLRRAAVAPPSLKSSMVNSASEFARSYTWDKTARETLAVYRQLLPA